MTVSHESDDFNNALSPIDAAKLELSTDYLQYLGSEQLSFVTGTTSIFPPPKGDVLDVVAHAPGQYQEGRWEVSVDGLTANLTYAPADPTMHDDYKYSMSVTRIVDGVPIPEPPTPEEAKAVADAIYTQSLSWQNGEQSVIEETTPPKSFSTRILGWLGLDVGPDRQSR